MVGGGYIGMEGGEGFGKGGIERKIVEIGDRILNRYLDEELSEILEEN
ncbi:NAD-binding protein [Staphylococcus capitis]|nr:NAD-binding protein [Staphylococcus capitis]